MKINFRKYYNMYKITMDGKEVSLYKLYGAPALAAQLKESDTRELAFYIKALRNHTKNPDIPHAVSCDFHDYIIFLTELHSCLVNKYNFKHRIILELQKEKPTVHK